MDILEFARFVSLGKSGTFSVDNDGGHWKIIEVGSLTGYQVGVGNVGLIPLQRDGEPVNGDSILADIVGAVSNFYYGSLNEDRRWLGVWAEDENGDTTAWIDKTVLVQDKLSANIVGAVLGEKEIYDWANNKCLTVIKAGE